MGNYGLPAYNASALSINITVFRADDGGSIKAWPTGLTEPNIATMRFDNLERTTNSVLVNIGDEQSTRGIEVRNDSSVTVDIGINTEGWFSEWNRDEDLNTGQTALDVAHACMVQSGQVPATSTTGETLGTATIGGGGQAPTGAAVDPSSGCVNTAIASVLTAVEEAATEQGTIAAVEQSLKTLSETASATPEAFPETAGPSIVDDDTTFADTGSSEPSGDGATTLDRWKVESDYGSYLVPCCDGDGGPPPDARREVPRTEQPKPQGFVGYIHGSTLQSWIL